MATAKEKVAFVTHINIEEYDLRAGFCMKAVVNKVVPQPEFKEGGMHEWVCKEKIPFLQKICEEFVN